MLTLHAKRLCALAHIEARHIGLAASVEEVPSTSHGTATKVYCPLTYPPLRELTPPLRRPLSVLSSLPSTRPTLSAARTIASSPIADNTPTSSLAQSQPTFSPLALLQQVRGAKRDTFNPSHVVRKRRHGFLARLRTRTGRMVLKRRKAKKRNTLSH